MDVTKAEEAINNNCITSIPSNKSIDSSNTICSEQRTVSDHSPHCLYPAADEQSHVTKNEKNLYNGETNINALRQCATEEGYRCGSCIQLFSSICHLHEHLQDSHESVSSYHYIFYLKTAFPKFDTCCQFTQTGESEKEKESHVTVEVTNFESENKSHADRENEKGRALKFQKTSDINYNAVEESLASTKDGIQSSDNNFTWKNVRIENVVSVPDVNYNADDGDNYFDDGDEAEESAIVTKYLTETENPSEKDSNDGYCSKKEKIVDETKSTIHKLSKAKFDRTENKDSENHRSKQTHRKDKLKIPRGQLPVCKVLQDPIPDGACKCELCGAKFSFKRGLLRHEQMKHLSEMKNECPYCNQKFMREYNLQKHIKCVHTIGRGQKYKEKYRTKKRQEKEEARVADLAAQSEMEIESEEAEVEEKKDDKNKEESVSPKAPHKCTICGYTVPRSKIDVHQRLHSGNTHTNTCNILWKSKINM